MDNNTIITLKLPLSSVQTIVNALAKQPFETVAPVINDISAQHQALVNAEAKQTAEAAHSKD